MRMDDVSDLRKMLNETVHFYDFPQYKNYGNTIKKYYNITITKI